MFEPLAREPEEVYYPESDGKPLAETDTHRDEMMDPFFAVRWHLRNEPETYVSANILLYYEAGKGGRQPKSVAPDLFVVRGVGGHRRRTYKLWEEGRPPDLVVEISSADTWAEDLGSKKLIYARMGVAEYYLFDPTGDYLDEPHLRAFRLKGKRYVEVRRGPFVSPTLGLEFRPVGEALRLIDPQTGDVLPVPHEAYQKWAEAETRARQELAARLEAEARVSHEVARRGQAEARASKEAVAREQAESALERALVEREEAEGRARLLQAELDRLRGV